MLGGTCELLALTLGSVALRFLYKATNLLQEELPALMAVESRVLAKVGVLAVKHDSRAVSLL